MSTLLKAKANEIAQKHAALFPRYTNAEIAKHVGRDVKIIELARAIVYSQNDAAQIGAYRNGYESKS